MANPMSWAVCRNTRTRWKYVHMCKSWDIYLVLLHNLIKIHIIIILQWHFIDAIFYVMIDVQLRYPHYRALFWFIQGRFLYQNKQNHNYKFFVKSFFSTSKMEIAYFTRKNNNSSEKIQSFRIIIFINLTLTSTLPLLFENTDSIDIFDLK